VSASTLGSADSASRLTNLDIVNHELLRSWLGLPPGAWPPDHYTLLGLPAGYGDIADFEPRVLSQMERLRIHQLLHPELVTEGMNRLAQALITLTDPAAKAAYDSELGIHALPPPASPPMVEAAPESLIVAEPVLDDEDLPEAEPVADPFPTEVTQELFASELPEPYEVVPDPVVPPPPAPLRAEVVRPWPTPPSTRRVFYRRLAFLRKCRRAWLKLRPVFLDPHDPLDRPGRVLLLLQGAEAVRPLLADLAGVAGGLGEPGGSVAAIFRQPLILDTIRRLLPDQRERVAADWRAGLQAIDHEYDRVRQVARDERAKAENAPQVPRLLVVLRDFPEWLLVGFGLFILLISVGRSLLSRSP
jgi:hypothetical protein